MRFGSLFSGIGAPETAWRPLGWECAWTAEIDPFASAVLRARFPGVPNLGDVTKANWHAARPVGLMVFGSPCQSFSVAGKRLGLDDPRGNLALYALGVARILRPRWLVFENVPGLLSSEGGRDFGAFLGLMGECGYGFAYRVLDAQYAGVPQRRRRVFVVGYLGDWRPPAAVLFEPESLSGHPPPRREAGQRVADHLTVGANQYSGFPGEPVEGRVARPLAGGSPRSAGYRNDADTADKLIAGTVRSHPRPGSNSLGAIAFDARQSDVIQYGDRTGQLDTDGHTMAVAFGTNGHGQGWTNEVVGALQAQQVGDGSARQAGLLQASTVRRLTPRECERLQGFPDDFTLIQYRGKPAADGPRYKALGNSMAVPVVRWIGERIAAFEAANISRNGADSLAATAAPIPSVHLASLLHATEHEEEAWKSLNHPTAKGCHE